MLTCQDVTDYLLDQELGELPAELLQDLAAHQAACPPCAAFARSYRAVPGMVRAALESDLTDELHEQLDLAILEAIRRAG